MACPALVWPGISWVVLLTCFQRFLSSFPLIYAHFRSFSLIFFSIPLVSYFINSSCQGHVFRLVLAIGSLWLGLPCVVSLAWLLFPSPVHLVGIPPTTSIPPACTPGTSTYLPNTPCTGLTCTRTGTRTRCTKANLPGWGLTRWPQATVHSLSQPEPDRVQKHRLARARESRNPGLSLKPLRGAAPCISDGYI